jgi:parvulin-like peptidyl-prolyl isomerase
LEGGLSALSRLRRPGSTLFGGASDLDPERRNAVMLIGGISLVVALAIALIVYGYYTDRVQPQRENVLRVGDRHYTYSYVERRVLSDVAQGIFNNNDVQQGVTQSVARIQREELIRVIARERGITASDEEIDDELAEILNLGQDVEHNVIAATLREEVLRVKLPLDEYLETIEADVLEKKIEASLSGGLPADAEQINLLYIQGGTQSNSVTAKKALDEGQSFEDVARKHSQHDSASQGGVMGWVPKELLDPELAPIAFALSGRSDIIETREDFYIIEVLGKEVRPVDENTREEIGTNGVRDLLEQAFTNTDFAYDLSQEQLVRLANKIGTATSG